MPEGHEPNPVTAFVDLFTTCTIPYEISVAKNPDKWWKELTAKTPHIHFVRRLFFGRCINQPKNTERKCDLIMLRFTVSELTIIKRNKHNLDPSRVDVPQVNIFHETKIVKWLLFTFSSKSETVQDSNRCKLRVY